MILIAESEPVAGSHFTVVASDFVGAANIQIYLRHQLVWEDECPDPPCHEIYFVPPRTGGATLTVIATDSIGQREELEFTVHEVSEGRMTAGA